MIVVIMIMGGAMRHGSVSENAAIETESKRSGDLSLLRSLCGVADDIPGA